MRPVLARESEEQMPPPNQRDEPAGSGDRLTTEGNLGNGHAGNADRSYRTDIDGIRSLAILSVALFHAGVPGLAGGFTGVDVFFVLSGYLIGGHIFGELQAHRFSYLRFYQRRAKRILPAFYMVLEFILLGSLVL